MVASARVLGRAAEGRIRGMNGRRYESYLYVTRLLRSDLFGDLDREVLQDAAEGMLLARGPRTPELEEIRGKTSAVLAELVLVGRINASTALEVQGFIHRCGPADVTRGEARDRSETGLPATHGDPPRRRRRDRVREERR
jgi:hypothetical protein